MLIMHYKAFQVVGSIDSCLYTFESPETKPAFRVADSIASLPTPRIQ